MESVSRSSRRPLSTVLRDVKRISFGSRKIMYGDRVTRIMPRNEFSKEKFHGKSHKCLYEDYPKIQQHDTRIGYQSLVVFDWWNERLDNNAYLIGRRLRDHRRVQSAWSRKTPRDPYSCSLLSLFRAVNINGHKRVSLRWSVETIWKRKR